MKWRWSFPRIPRFPIFWFIFCGTRFLQYIPQTIPIHIILGLYYTHLSSKNCRSLKTSPVGFVQAPFSHLYLSNLQWNITIKLNSICISVYISWLRIYQHNYPTADCSLPLACPECHMSTIIPIFSLDFLLDNNFDISAYIYQKCKFQDILVTQTTLANINWWTKSPCLPFSVLSLP